MFVCADLVFVNNVALPNMIVYKFCRDFPTAMLVAPCGMPCQRQRDWYNRASQQASYYCMYVYVAWYGTTWRHVVHVYIFPVL